MSGKNDIARTNPDLNDITMKRTVKALPAIARRSTVGATKKSQDTRRKRTAEEIETANESGNVRRIVAVIAKEKEVVTVKENEVTKSATLTAEENTTKIIPPKRRVRVEVLMMARERREVTEPRTILI